MSYFVMFWFIQNPAAIFRSANWKVAWEIFRAFGMEVDGDEAGVGRRTSADDCLNGLLRRSLLSTRLRQLEESVSLMVRHSLLNIRYIISWQFDSTFSEANHIPAACILSFCSEGDNANDAVQMATHVNEHFDWFKQAVSGSYTCPLPYPEIKWVHATIHWLLCIFRTEFAGKFLTVGNCSTVALSPKDCFNLEACSAVYC